jgi:DNA polymerase V
MFLMRVDCDSMMDAGILHGDLLVVDWAAHPENGCVVIVALNGEYSTSQITGLSISASSRCS